MPYRLAVDLGTTFTAAAISDGVSPPSLVGLGNRAMQVPSVLFVNGDGSYLAGEDAERRALSDPSRVVREFKRRMGDPVPILVGAGAYSPEALMARLLRWVVDIAGLREGLEPSQVVLTHPANWGPYKLELFEQVAAIAQIPAHAVRFCSEPVAAAVQYVARQRVPPGRQVLIYDLGGGTFDVCILEATDDGFIPRGSPDGLEHFGGVDFDEVVLRLVVDGLGVPLDHFDGSDPAVAAGLLRLRSDCVAAKEALSTDIDTAVHVAFPGLTRSVRITRAEFEAALRPTLVDTLATTRRAINSANVAPDKLHSVVITGGSSRIPLVSEMLQHEFAVPIALDNHPKHDIALGAARYNAVWLNELPASDARSTRTSGTHSDPTEPLRTTESDHPQTSTLVKGSHDHDAPQFGTGAREMPAGVREPEPSKPAHDNQRSSGPDGGAEAVKHGGSPPAIARPTSPADITRGSVQTDPRRKMGLRLLAAVVLVVVLVVAVVTFAREIQGGDSVGGAAPTDGASTTGPEAPESSHVPPPSRTSSSSNSGAPAATPSRTRTNTVSFPQLHGSLPLAERCHAAKEPYAAMKKSQTLYLECSEGELEFEYRVYRNKAALARALTSYGIDGRDPHSDCYHKEGQTRYTSRRDGAIVRSGRLYCAGDEGRGQHALYWTEDRLMVFAIAEGPHTTFASLMSWWKTHGGPYRSAG